MSRMMIETDRLSVGYYHNNIEDIEHNSHMFMEDLYQHIVPVYGNYYDNIKCYLEPSNSGFEEQLGKILPAFNRGYREDFKEIILSSIRYVAARLVQQGFLVFEFVKTKDFAGNEHFKLEDVYGLDVTVKKDNIEQVIPDDALQIHNVTNPIVIPRSKCYIIEFPDALGGKNKFIQFMKEFKTLGEQSPMMCFFSNPLSGKPGYNVIEHQRLHELELWKKSKRYNWHHRGIHDKELSPYYNTYRRLLFSRTQIILRDYVVKELKALLSNIGLKLGHNLELRVEGLTSLSTTDKKIKDWETGNISPNFIDEIT